MLQDPRHSSLLHRYKGCPIYREQSAIAMEPWPQPVGLELKEYIQQLLTLQACTQYTHMIIHIYAHTHFFTISKETIYYTEGHDPRWPFSLLLKMLLTSLTNTCVCIDGDKLGLKRARMLSFARHLSVLYNKNSNYGKLIMLWNIKRLMKNKPGLMKHILHPPSPWLPNNNSAGRLL